MSEYEGPSVWLMYDNHTFRRLKGTDTDLPTLRKHAQPYCSIFSRNYVKNCAIHCRGQETIADMIDEYATWLRDALDNDERVARTMGFRP